jgi:Ca2+-binding RTX toxin-like protein
MARLSYNPGTSTVSFGDIASITVTNATVVTANATTLHVRVTLSGTISGTLDAVYTGNFTTIAGIPTGGVFTGLRVDLNGQTLLQVSDFSLPFSATQNPDFNNLVATILDGNDVVSGGALADVLQGFAGIDNIDGGAGLDIINGNQGNDSLVGGDGNDVVRGGKDDDVILGGAGSDFLSGDRGADTLTGGAAADTFHTFAGAGLDRITDFSRAEGDRVLVFTGQTYTVSQQGADTVVDLGGGTQMVLVGVQQSSLTDGWIVTL